MILKTQLDHTSQNTHLFRNAGQASSVEAVALWTGAVGELVEEGDGLLRGVSLLLLLHHAGLSRPDNQGCKLFTRELLAGMGDVREQEEVGGTRYSGGEGREREGGGGECESEGGGQCVWERGHRERGQGEGGEREREKR